MGKDNLGHCVMKPNPSFKSQEAAKKGVKYRPKTPDARRNATKKQKRKGTAQIRGEGGTPFFPILRMHAEIKHLQAGAGCRRSTPHRK